MFLRYSLQIYVEGLWKRVINLTSHECRGRDAGEKTPECDARVRNTRQRRSCRETGTTYDDGNTY